MDLHAELTDRSVYANSLSRACCQSARIMINFSSLFKKLSASGNLSWRWIVEKVWY